MYFVNLVIAIVYDSCNLPLLRQKTEGKQNEEPEETKGEEKNSSTCHKMKLVTHQLNTDVLF